MTCIARRIAASVALIASHDDRYRSASATTNITGRHYRASKTPYQGQNIEQRPLNYGEPSRDDRRILLRHENRQQRAAGHDTGCRLCFTPRTSIRLEALMRFK